MVIFLTLRTNKCLLGWFLGKGVPKCPDDTEDWFACVSKAVLQMHGVTFGMVLLNGIRMLKFKIR